MSITIIDWNNFSYNWIGKNDSRYLFIKKNLIEIIFPNLNDVDQNLLFNNFILLINVIYIKFNMKGYDDQFWYQLQQNNMLDMKALLNMMLPFILENNGIDPRKNLRSLKDLYLEKNEGKYVYTNSQYNRCIRRNNNTIILRPFIKEYFLQNIKMLLMTIDSVSHKLYINWVDIVPILMNEYNESNIYIETKKKLETQPITYPLYDGYIDMQPGLSIGDIYNTISNHLFHEIKNHKWLIYDLNFDGEIIPAIRYFEIIFTLKNVWDGKMWSQLNDDSINLFRQEWNTFINNRSENGIQTMGYFYFFFQKYHKNAEQLIRNKQLIRVKLPSNIDEDDVEDYDFTTNYVEHAKEGLAKVPIEELYIFFLDQFNDFKKTWFYYSIYINKKNTLNIVNNQKIYVTHKNVYNFAKSLIHYDVQEQYVEMAKYWYGLTSVLTRRIIARLLKQEKTQLWFVITGYLRRIYNTDSSNISDIIYSEIRNKFLIEIIMESLIYHGMLSEFRPQRTITDNNIIRSKVGINNDNAVKLYKYSQMKLIHFNEIKKSLFENEAYYFITNKTYGQLQSFKSKKNAAAKKYFDYLTSEQIWTFTYAMNWLSQVNFYHHYLHNRVIYVTGATGVGKSTQVPKLLIYCQKMLDYRINGKIICTQPRVSPTVGNAETISRELGVPIISYNEEYDQNIPTNNYYVQFKYKDNNHVSNISSFFRIVTDGTLLEEIKKSPFLSLSKSIGGAVTSSLKEYTNGNIYDIIIVDEAHEHNMNMDLILTFVRDAIYVNNSLKLVIVSATMDDDEPIYRRYYRDINDNRMYPLNMFIVNNSYDRVNIDRRIHISAPGQTTQAVIKDVYLNKQESDSINENNFVKKGIEKAIQLANETNNGDILLFMSGQKDIQESEKEINAKIPADIICLGFYSAMGEERRDLIMKLDQKLRDFTRYKEDINLEEENITRRLPRGTYKRAIIVATNIAEASITLVSLKYVIDTGYAKVNVYDPMRDVNDLKTLPISDSSSKQRRGRVGRVSSGEVYYLYDREKITNNKTFYQIANSDIIDTIVSLLKSDILDYPIINEINDINQIENLNKIQQNGNQITNIYDVLINPLPYIDIITKQYIHNNSSIYSYYGKHKASIKIESLNDYLIANHDDYDYQINMIFSSRCYTGYDEIKLRDNNLQFYLIHPDENIIKRDPYFGTMIGLKYNPSVDVSYYNYILENNNLSQMNINSFTKKIENEEFHFGKFDLAIQNATMLSLIAYINNYDPSSDEFEKLQPNYNKEYMNLNIVKNYFMNLHELYHTDYVLIRTLFCTKIDEIKTIIANYDVRELLWYAYGVPYQIEDDIIAVNLLLSIADTISILSPHVTGQSFIKLFFDINHDDKGDIHQLWKLWNQIKQLLIKNNVYTFDNNDKYIAKIKILKEKNKRN